MYACERRAVIRLVRVATIVERRRLKQGKTTRVESHEHRSYIWGVKRLRRKQNSGRQSRYQTSGCHVVRGVEMSCERVESGRSVALDARTERNHLN